MSARNTSTASRIIEYARRHVRLTAAAAVVIAAGVVGVALVISGIGLSASHASLSPKTNCSPVPSKCGFPDATNTGVPSGTVLKTVPGQVSKGPGWAFNSASQQVNVTGSGANLTGLNIPYTVNVYAPNVTINNDKIVTDGYFGVSLRHAPGVVISNSVISGVNTGAGEVGSAIIDVYSDSSSLVIKGNNISAFRTAVQVTTGQITGNYIHNPGFVAGDHTNGILDIGTKQPLTISGNTILNSISQTDAISLDATLADQAIANKTVTGNLLGGGSYAVYGGNARSAATSNIVVKNNNFSQAYYPKSGQYGPVAYFATGAAGNCWCGNTWDTTGLAVPAP